MWIRNRRHGMAREQLVAESQDDFLPRMVRRREANVSRQDLDRDEGGVGGQIGPPQLSHASSGHDAGLNRSLRHKLLEMQGGDRFQVVVMTPAGRHEEIAIVDRLHERPNDSQPGVDQLRNGRRLE